MHRRPKKSLGQNFLRDANVLRNIITTLDPKAGDVVCEIGPGDGSLTRGLVDSDARVIAVELDDVLFTRLRSEFGETRLALFHQDVLTTDFHQLAQWEHKRLRIVGNIPYNITSPILFRLIDFRHDVIDATLMMQREVARRIVAQPGTKDYGIMAVATQLVADVRLHFDVSPRSFRPIPDVLSSLVQISFLDSPRFPVRDELFMRHFIRTAFGKRRKMLRNSLLDIVKTRDVLDGIPHLDERPEALTVQQLVGMANVLFERAGHG